MKYLFSASSMGFYSSGRPAGIPIDAVEISNEEYLSLLDGQSKGKLISAGSNGYPILVDPTPPSAAEMAISTQAKCMANANQQISIIKPAVDGGYAKPEHTKLLEDWQRYRYELTLIPEQPGWPDQPSWPTEPEKII
ncbi:tail fiber assembly protein [Aeromonas sp. L_1B5_3]|uniref:tail fiber assembly protein n=1 Tax=Aeromonas sp. L_1B5_3 TaxID=1588629 RepID=UPI0005B69A9A|nr:tail fiber assembly protein [Aeromonas sp. L_1B5_3]KIQ80034.1 tail fiber assembly protein [Aeromonas sp. L_1B5_3]